MRLTADFRKVPQSYIGFVEKLPGASTPVDRSDEARARLAEAVELVREGNRPPSEEALEGQEGIRAPMRVAAA